jgi:predicted alpha/beta superfamily hydrolase
MKKILLSLLVGTFGLVAVAQPNSNKNESSVLKLGITDKIQSVELGEKRTLNIYLPDGYKDNPSATFPVIYLLDGSENEDLLHIVGLVQFLTMIEKMPKSIVVGIANIDRRRDFTYPTRNAKDKADFPTTGSSVKFINFVEKELQPYLNRNYKTNGEKTIIGQSLGGLVATEILLKKPQLFDKYVIVSPSLWWDDESLLTEIPNLAAKQPKGKVYITVGSEGKQMEGDAKMLAEKLQALNLSDLKITFSPMPEENHLTILHQAAYKALEAVNKK